MWLGCLQGKVYITHTMQEEWNEDCLIPKFQKQDLVIILIVILVIEERK